MPGEHEVIYEKSDPEKKGFGVAPGHPSILRSGEEEASKGGGGGGQ